MAIFLSVALQTLRKALSTTDFDSLIAGFALRGIEACTKIIECEAAKSMASIAGVNIPYGILLEGYFDVPLTLTAIPAVPAPTAQVNEVVWSPDGKLVAVVDDNSVFTVYTFDRTSFT